MINHTKEVLPFRQSVETQSQHAADVETHGCASLQTVPNRNPFRQNQDLADFKIRRIPVREYRSVENATPGKDAFRTECVQNRQRFLPSEAILTDCSNHSNHINHTKITVQTTGDCGAATTMTVRDVGARFIAPEMARPVQTRFIASPQQRKSRKSFNPANPDSDNKRKFKLNNKIINK